MVGRFLNMKLILVLIGLSFVSGCDISFKDADGYLERATQFYDKNNYRAAIIELKNALKRDPEHANSRKLLGEIYLLMGRGADAEKELTLAEKFGVPYEDLAQSLGKSFIQQNKIDELIKDFQVTPGDSSGLKAVKLSLLGSAYLQKKNFDKASLYFDEALNEDHNLVDAIIGTATIALLNGNPESAIQLVERAEKISDDPEIWLIKADALRVEGKDDLVMQVLEKITETSAPGSRRFQIASRRIIQEHIQHGDLKSAKESYAKLSKTFNNNPPSDIVITHLRSILELDDKDYESASELSDKILVFDPSHQGALFISGYAKAELGNFAQAEKDLSRLIDLSPEQVQARKILGKVYIKQNMPEKALAVLAPLADDKTNPETSILKLAANSALLAGMPERSNEYLIRAIQQAPDDPSLRFSLAQTHIAQDDFKLALEELSVVGGAEEMKNQAILSEAEVLLKTGKPDEAINKLNLLKAKMPDSPIPVALIGSAFLIKGAKDTAEEKFREALLIDADFAPAIRTLAYMKITDGQFREAEDLYEKAIASKSIQQISLFHDYAKLFLLQNKKERALQVLDKAEAFSPGNEETLLLTARTYLKYGEPFEAINRLRGYELESYAIEIEKGNAHMLLKEYQLAIDAYKRAAKLNEKSALASYLVGSGYIAISDREEAKHWNEVALERDPEFLPALLYRIHIAFLNGDLVKAESTINTLKYLLPGNGSIPYFEAELAMREEKPQEAIDILSSAMQDNPDNEKMASLLVQAYWKNNQKMDALKLLEEKNKQAPDNISIQFQLASAYAELDRKDAAQAIYEHILKTQPNHAFALNNLAWLIKDSQPGKALKYAQRAVQLAPENKDIQQTFEEIKKQTN